MYNPITAGHASQIEALNKFIDRASRTDLIRLNTYLRRYIAPQVVKDLFLQEMLDDLLKPHLLSHIVALVFDIRGFVRTTRIGEENLGLRSVSDLLRKILPEIIRIGFENRGLVGEFSGDRVMITFGFPEIPGLFPSAQEQLKANIRQAVRTAVCILEMVDEVKEKLDETLRNFDIGIGICAGGKAWVGNLDNEWRQELTVISTAVNIAARAEELTKKEELIAAVPGLKIIVSQDVLQQFQPEIARGYFKYGDFGEQKVRGLETTVSLFHIQEVVAEKVFPANGDTYTPDNIDLVHWLTDYIDGAIERDISLKVRQTLSHVGQIIISEDDEVPVLEEIMGQIKEFFGAETASLYLIDPENGDLIFESSIGPTPPPQGTRLPAGKGIAGFVAQTQKPYLSSDVHKDDKWFGHFEKSGDHHSMMCVPLLVQHKTIGVIQIIEKRINAFSDKDLNALLAFASSATIAISDAQRYEQDTFMRQTQNEITEALTTSLDLEKILDTVIYAIKRVLNPQSATLYLLDKISGELIFRKVLSKSEDPPQVGQRLAAGQGIAGWVVTKKTNYLSPDVHDDPHWYGKIDPATRSMLCVPMLVNREVVGVIQVIDDQPDVFNDRDLDTLKWLAASVAVAIDNATKYEELEVAHRRFVAAETVAALGDIAGKLAHNLTNEITAIRYIANSILEDPDDEDVSEAAEEILESAEDALREIERMREPLKSSGEQITALEQALQEVVEEARERLSSKKKRAQTAPIIQIHSPSLLTSPFIRGGKTQIKYIFRNLIDNAVRAIGKKDGGTGTITIREVNNQTEQSQWVEIEVADTGIGIPQAMQKHIFELGHTDKPEGQVGGYGLFWVALTLQRLNGDISVKSQEGVGTTFTVKLPLLVKVGEES